MTFFYFYVRATGELVDIWSTDNPDRFFLAAVSGMLDDNRNLFVAVSSAPRLL